MRIYKKARRTVQILENAVCNQCGKTCFHDGDFYGLSSRVTGGYFSTHLNDMTTYYFDLCESCLSDLFRNFKFSPTTEN